MKKYKSKIIIVSVIAITFVILVTVYLIMMGFTKNNITDSGKKELETKTILADYKDTDYVICKNDILNPEIVYFGEKKDIPNTFFIIYSKYSRSDIFSKNWNVENNGGGSFYNTNKDKVKSILLSKPCNDLQKSQTIDGVQITYNPPLTPQQIQKAQTDQQSSTNQQQYLDPITKEPDGAYKACIVVLEYFKRVEQAIKEGKTEIYNDISKETIPLTPDQLSKAQSVIESQQKQCDNQKSK
jgi:hypothetical protein